MVLCFQSSVYSVLNKLTACVLCMIVFTCDPKVEENIPKCHDLNILIQMIDQRVHVLLNDHAQNENKKQ